MKKVLSFVLVLTLVLGSFSMVFAAPAQKTLSDIAGSANEEAIQVVNDLGIITGYEDGSFKGANNVTRAEFAAMITRALAIPDSALSGYSASTFKDTAGYGWAVSYLAFCQSKGIMIGDGNGNAMPGRTITVNEAMTMTLRAIGYTNSSSVLVGTWPSNYVTLGQTLGLYDDVATATTINRESAAQVIYNALTVALVQVATDGTTDRIVAEKIGDETIYRTLLTSGLGCDIDNNGEAYVIVGDENSTINLMPYQGAYAVTYSKDDEIVAVGEVKSTFLTGDLDGSELDVDGTTYKFKTGAEITDDGNTFANGDEGNASGSAIAAYDGATVTVAVELTGKTVKNLYSIATWKVNATEQFAEDDLDEESICGYDFILDDDDAIDETSFVLLGVASINDIKENNVVEIYLNSDEEITKLAVGTDSVTGKVTRINTAGDKFTIDGKAYDATDDFIAEAPSVGDEGTAYMNYNGDLAVWEEDNAAAGNYAVYMSYKDGDAFDDAKVKLYTAADGEKTYNVDDKCTTSAGLKAGAIIEYSLNKNGDVNKMVIPEHNETATSPDSIDFGGNNKVSKSGTIIGTTPVVSNVIVFVVDEDGDYSVEKITNLQKDEAIKATVAVKNSDGKVTAILISDNDLDKGDATYGVINEVGSAKNDDDDNVQYIIGFVDGKAIDTQTDDNTDFEKTTTTSGLAEITVNADGLVTDVKAVSADDVTIEDFDGNTVETVRTSAKEIVINGGTYKIADDAVIYVWSTEDEEWSAKTAMSAIKKGNSVIAYQTDDDIEGFDIILTWE